MEDGKVTVPEKDLTKDQQKKAETKDGKSTMTVEDAKQTGVLTRTNG